MYTGLTVLTLYTLWTVALLLALAAARSSLVMLRKHAPNKFDPSGADMPPAIHRLTRTHANCIESYPWIATPLLLAATLDLHHIVSSLAWPLLIARLAQSVVHLISTHSLAVQIRFVLFMVQIAIVVYWCVLLLMHFSTMV